MKYAWIENDLIRDVCNSDPFALFYSDIAVLYSTEVPDNAENGDTFSNGVLSKKEIQVQPIVTPEIQTPDYPKVDVITYKMLFTSAERIATKASNDPVIIDLQELMNDPRTVNVNLSLKSVQDALDYMTYLGILAPGRKAEILTGDLK